MVRTKPEFVKSLNKASNKYIAEARKRNKEHIKKFGDFGTSHHSTPLTKDNDFIDFRNYIGQKSWEYLDHQGLWYVPIHNFVYWTMGTRVC